MKFFAMKRYELTVEVYTEELVFDPVSGGSSKQWNYASPQIIKCKARSSRPWGSVEDFGATYADKEYLELYSPGQVGLAKRIGRIRNRKGLTLWKNDNGTATVFNVSGCSPLNDANGRTIDHLVLLELVTPQPNVSA